jgi:hypothetical protein
LECGNRKLYYLKKCPPHAEISASGAGKKRQKKKYIDSLEK